MCVGLSILLILLAATIQAQSLAVILLTVTVGYSDTLEDSQTITNDFEVVTVTLLAQNIINLSYFRWHLRNSTDHLPV